MTDLDEAARLVAASAQITIGKGRDLDLAGVAGPIAINPANLSAAFLAGTTVAAIQAALAPHGLWWPVAARPDRTLGAVLATAGPVRDWVLGLEVILAGGRRTHLGGSTMKNVAGYDLTRLFVGSRGTLGVIGAATLRLLPRPPGQAAPTAYAEERRPLPYSPLELALREAIAPNRCFNPDQ